MFKHETRDHRYSIDWCCCIHGLYVLLVVAVRLLFFIKCVRFLDTQCVE